MFHHHMKQKLKVRIIKKKKIKLLVSFYGTKVIAKVYVVGVNAISVET